MLKGWPSACHPSLQGSNAAVVTVVFLFPKYFVFCGFFTGGEQGVSVKDDRLRVTRLCRVLTQRS